MPQKLTRYLIIAKRFEKSSPLRRAELILRKEDRTEFNQRDLEQGIPQENERTWGKKGTLKNEDDTMCSQISDSSRLVAVASC